MSRGMRLYERTQVLVPTLGPLRFVATDEALTALHFGDFHRAPTPLSASPLEESARHGVLEEAIRQVDEYTRGQRTSFSIPLAPDGTDFQREVWRALVAIPFGETRTYGDIARTVGRPRAVRAVGATNGKNPIGIVVPCHRVIGKNGTLTGYAGGLEKKAFLLALERQGIRSSKGQLDIFADRQDSCSLS